jgi:glutaminyl-peptide cyclotransferase
MTMRPLTSWSFRFLAGAVLLVLASCTTPPRPPVSPPIFDQDSAYRRLGELCAFGPRYHGSDGKSKAESWIIEQLRDAGAQVSVHEFEFSPKGTNITAHFRNIVGRIKPELEERVLVGTHYDTRSINDRELDQGVKMAPIIGANDGGSGVAVILEMAARWKERPPLVGVDLIFFDGEEYGRNEQWDEYFLGSKAWVRDHPDYAPVWGVILDMVGDSSFEIRKERESVSQAPAIVQRLWDAAARVRATGIVDRMGGRVLDDHNAFLQKGIPVVLLIDFDYVWFHTTGDTLDKCSPDSLGQVGRTVMEAVAAS